MVYIGRYCKHRVYIYTCFTDNPENRFWKRLITEYLTPEIGDDGNDNLRKKQIEKQLSDLRNAVFPGFIQINALFITAVFILQQINQTGKVLYISMVVRWQLIGSQRQAVLDMITAVVLIYWNLIFETKKETEQKKNGIAYQSQFRTCILFRISPMAKVRQFPSTTK